jgi:hypothetical protein
MAIEVSIILKDSERKFVHKFLVYETFSLSLDDLKIKEMVEIAKKSFGGEAEDVTLKVSMEL